jgi:hypothetical protein
MITRKTTMLTAAALVGLATAWAWAAVSETEPEGTSEIKQLKKQIADLEKRIERLERQRGSMAVPGRPFGFNAPVPRNWQRRDFNGQPYYLIPLGQTSSPETEPNGPGIRKGNQAGQQRP